MNIISFLLCALTISTSSIASTLPINLVDENKVFAQNKPIILLGKGVSVNEQAPEFKVVNESFKPVQLSDFQNKVVILSIVPSIDTGTCSLQTKYFNDKISKEFKDFIVLTLSADLPFAQKRFCKTQNVDQIITLSDTVWRDFGMNYGLYIKDMGLLTRAVFILDKTHKIIYKQLVKDLSSEPDYNQVINALKNI